MVKSRKQNNSLLDVVLVLSVALSVYFFYSVLVVLQDVRVNDVLGSPNSYAAWPGLVLAIYVFYKTESQSKKYISISVITLLTSGLLVWLFGATNAIAG